MKLMIYSIMPNSDRDLIKTIFILIHFPDLQWNSVKFLTLMQ